MDPTIGKYVPFEVDTSGNPTGKHNCPNSDYNRQNVGLSTGTPSNNYNPSTFTGTPQQQQQQQQQQQTAIDKPTLDQLLLNQVSQKVDGLQNQLNDLKYFTENEIKELVEQVREISKNSNIILQALAEHFKLNEPKKASELWQEGQQQQQQQQQDEIS
jgi:hypothetical protein